jgi:hypothetical protein
LSVFWTIFGSVLAAGAALALLGIAAVGAYASFWGLMVTWAEKPGRVLLGLFLLVFALALAFGLVR